MLGGNGQPRIQTLESKFPGGIEMHAPDVIYHVAATGLPPARSGTAVEVR